MDNGEKIVTLKASSWTINDMIIDFSDGKQLEVGKDIPADIGADMVAHGYAKVVVETKVVPEPEPELESVPEPSSAPEVPTDPAPSVEDEKAPEEPKRPTGKKSKNPVKENK